MKETQAALLRKFAIWALLQYTVAAPVCAQVIERLNTFSYSVNEGLLQSTMSDMAFDKNNFCWISFSNGLQKFDGSRFTMVPVQAGLPDNKSIHFIRCRNGDLYFCYARGVSRYDIANDRFVQVYSDSTETRSPNVIGEDGPNIYLHTYSGKLLSINKVTGKLESSVRTEFAGMEPGSEYRATVSNIADHKVAFQSKGILYLFDLRKNAVIASSASPLNILPFFLYLQRGEKVIFNIYDVHKALHCYDFATGKITTLDIPGKPDERISRWVLYPWQDKMILSFNNRIYHVDSSLQVLRSEIVNFQNQPGAGNNSIYKIREDNFGNLFVSTISGGFRKIIRNNYPLRYYGTANREANNVLSLLPDKKNNRILVGTVSSGLQVYDTLQRLVKEIKMKRADKRIFTPNVILKDSKGNYWLLCNSEQFARKFSPDLSKADAVPIIYSDNARRGTAFFGNSIYQDRNEAIVQSQGAVFRIDFNAGTVKAHEFSSSYIMGGIRHGNYIISHGNDELIYLDATTFRELKKVPFGNTGYVRCFAKDDKGNLYLGCNRGIFMIDVEGRILSHLTREQGLPDDCVYSILVDRQGALWCSSNKGIFKVYNRKGILQLKKDDGLQDNEFNTNVAAISEDGEFFFGGMNGVSSFYPAAISSLQEKVNILVTNISVNNEDAFKEEAAWNIDRISLPYNRNALSFDLIAMADNNPEQYVYQYQMEGMDKGWIQNNGMQTIKYLLPPGTYDLKLYAGRSFEKDAKPMKTIRIVIRQPFWRTWWFIAGLLLLFGSALAYGFNTYNKRKYRKRLLELEAEHKVQLEKERISRDLHDSIGAYANAVLYNTELLQKEEDDDARHELMNDLRFASKDIINSLRETIWALKKDNYTAQECLLRIKNFVQPFTRYYPQIQFRVHGEASSERSLDHNKALNVVMLVQEAVNNAIKHASPSYIVVKSSEAGGRWQLCVENDGHGFDYESTRDMARGNGLVNMKQRAAESGFEFSLQSEPGKGTRIELLI